MHVAFYLVAHLDILGQRDQLAKMRALPTSEDERKAMLEVLNATAFNVLRIRGAFQEFFKSAARSTGLLDALPAEQRSIADEMRRHKVDLRGWSDTFVVTVPLRNEDEHCTPMNSVHLALSAVAGTMLTSLVFLRLPLRGGMDVGLAVDLPAIPDDPDATLGPDTGEVYGPVVSEAYRLESQIAKYPRVVVGDQLVRYLDQVSGQRCSTPHGQLAARMASNCKMLLTRDYDDGLVMLDFLGPEMRGPAVSPDQVRGIRDFVASEHARFVAERNDKLAVRYKRFLRYCDSRLSA